LAGMDRKGGRSMSEEPEKAAPSEGIARLLAEQGEAAVHRMKATVERAHEMLANGEVSPPVEGVDPHAPAPYAWEKTEPRLDLPRRVWLASVSDFGTGEGMTAYFGASYAHDEDELRRWLSRQIGRELAHLAKVGEGLDSVPYADMFLSPHMKAQLEGFNGGEDRPAAMSFVANFWANYS
jgi:hypothetical protein